MLVMLNHEVVFRECAELARKELSMLLEIPEAEVDCKYVRRDDGNLDLEFSVAPEKECGDEERRLLGMVYARTIQMLKDRLADLKSVRDGSKKKSTTEEDGDEGPTQKDGEEGPTEEGGQEKGG